MKNQRATDTFESRKPNIVLIHTDQQRYDSLGCNGNPYAVTPNIDALAAEGTVFHRHIVSNPICQPSRASLLTGRYPNGHGLWTNGLRLYRVSETERSQPCIQRSLDWYGHDFAEDIPTLADVLGKAGYHTGAIGKLHLTPFLAPATYGYAESTSVWRESAMADWHGPYYGFRHVELAIGHGEHVDGHYKHWLEREFPDVANGLEKGSHKLVRPFPEVGDLYPSNVPADAHHSTWTGLRSEAFIEDASKRKEPFLLFAGFPDPHHPFTPSAELVDMFCDKAVTMPVGDDGLYDFRPEVWQNLYQNSNSSCNARSLSVDCVRLIRQYTSAQVYLIDQAVGRIIEALKTNGCWDNTIVIFTSDHGDFLGDYGLLRKELVCAEPLTHVPFIIRVPDQSLPAETDVPMSNVDVLPTLCQLADVDVPAGVQGSDIQPVVRGETENFPMVMAYQGNSRYHNFSIYDRHYRYTEYPATGESELYDHRMDPQETRNLVSDQEVYSEIKRLRHFLHENHLRTDTPGMNRVCMW